LEILTYIILLQNRPGTGKTSTMVESILQLLKSSESHRLLVCAPSNATTDLLTVRLAEYGVKPGCMLRLNALSRDIEEIMEDAIPYSLIDDHGVCSLPALKQILEARVILSTCCSAALLQTMNIPTGHFSTVFVDEAGQTDEPTSMIPVRAVASATTNIVLAGDPNQLRPVVFSSHASNAGLSTSLLERLMRIQKLYGSNKQTPGRRSCVLNCYFLRCLGS
jgi:helicase MOV-10